MLAIALSLLFGAAAFAAIAVIHASVVHGARRARLIWAELAYEPRRTARVIPGARPREQALPMLFAAA